MHRGESSSSSRGHCTPLLRIMLLIIITILYECVTDEHCRGGGTTTGDRG